MSKIIKPIACLYCGANGCKHCNSKGYTMHKPTLKIGEYITIPSKEKLIELDYNPTIMQELQSKSFLLTKDFGDYLYEVTPQ